MFNILQPVPRFDGCQMFWIVWCTFLAEVTSNFIPQLKIAQVWGFLRWSLVFTAVWSLSHWKIQHHSRWRCFTDWSKFVSSISRYTILFIVPSMIFSLLRPQEKQQHQIIIPPPKRLTVGNGIYFGLVFMRTSFSKYVWNCFYRRVQILFCLTIIFCSRLKQASCKA